MPPRTRSKRSATVPTLIDNHAYVLIPPMPVEYTKKREEETGKQKERIEEDFSEPETGRKAVFRDVTSDVYGTVPVEFPAKGGWRATRKPRTKLKRSVIPSSLPPSSPPVTSSQAPYGEPDFLFDVNDQLVPLNDEGEDDDPFGLLATERELRAQRIRQGKMRTTSTAPQDPDENGWQMHGEDKENVNHESSSLDPLLTPRKRVRKRPEPRMSSPATSSAPSTPSPIKHASVGITPETSFEAVRKEVAEEARNARKGRGKKPRLPPEAESNDPRQVVEDLEAMLPKRRSRKEKEIAKVRKKHGRPRKVQPTKDAEVRVERGKSKGVKVEDDESETEDEDRAKQRRAHIAYFKKLADYSFEKEDVYVI